MFNYINHTLIMVDVATFISMLNTNENDHTKTEMISKQYKFIKNLTADNVVTIISNIANDHNRFELIKFFQLYF